METRSGVVQPFAEKAAERFWRQVEKLPDDGCWLWKGPHNGRYGRIGRRTYAHRASWELSNGRPVPKGMHVMHRCDTPLCVRPEHLTIGTHRENMLDAKAKGRLAVGERHGMFNRPDRAATGARHGSKTKPWSISRGESRPTSKLTEADVRQIRWLSQLGESRAVLSRRYGVTPTVIRRIANYESWRHVR